MTYDPELTEEGNLLLQALDKLYNELSAVLKSESVKERFASLSYDPGGMPSAEFSAVLKSEIDKWTKVAREAHIRAQ